MRFSQRIGKAPTVKLVQKEDIDDDLRNSLWNAVLLVYIKNVGFQRYHHDETAYSNLDDLVTALWLHFFKQPLDQVPHYFHDVAEYLKSWFFNAQWFEVFDFEACLNSGPDAAKDDFSSICNAYFERENSAYRFVNGQLTEITSKEEIDAVEFAIQDNRLNGGARGHLRSALSLMNDKENPDFRNSIKESISSVESVARQLLNDEKATLGQALKLLERRGDLHTALKSAFSSLYGYTNDADGIRHALMDESKLTKADARFMLVVCSAFTNYLIEVAQLKA